MAHYTPGPAHTVRQRYSHNCKRGIAPPQFSSKVRATATAAVRKATATATAAARKAATIE